MLMVQWHAWRWGWACTLFGELVWIWPFRRDTGGVVNHGGWLCASWCCLISAHETPELSLRTLEVKGMWQNGFSSLLADSFSPKAPHPLWPTARFLVTVTAVTLGCKCAQIIHISHTQCIQDTPVLPSWRFGSLCHELTWGTLSCRLEPTRSATDPDVLWEREE